MRNALALKGKKSAYQLVFFQFISVLLCSSIFFVSLGVDALISSFLGGMIAVLPNLVFATFAFAHSGASKADKVVKSFYRGEALKLVTTVLLFSLVFANVKVGFMPTFVCYTLALIVHWIAPVFFKKK
ncbi:ATP synthase subunit I [Paraferrimonas sp. SM1919]|uniref:ATP synthase subunit I n=1 Tax=Paraferrimonas sp. SM1919 TaxID=2662263 RepID=UPI0013CFCC4C|nr:ATP synthase subunit I [Paraferrimonas sp. SM1919]